METLLMHIFSCFSFYNILKMSSKFALNLDLNSVFFFNSTQTMAGKMSLFNEGRSRTSFSYMPSEKRKKERTTQQSKKMKIFTNFPHKQLSFGLLNTLPAFFQVQGKYIFDVLQFFFPVSLLKLVNILFVIKWYKIANF